MRETRRGLEELKGSTDNARVGIEEWGEEIDKLPKQIKIGFDIPPFPEIKLPEVWIPVGWDIGAQPILPKFQVGIPNIPRTMPVIVHKEEAILTAPQAREWRAGRAGEAKQGDNTFNIRILHTGDIRSDMDEKKFVRKIADRITRNMERV